MDSIILSSSDERIVGLAILSHMIDKRIPSPLTPWLLRSLHYMKILNVLESTIQNIGELSNHLTVSTSIIVGTTHTRLLFIKNQRLPCSFMVNTMKNFLCIDIRSLSTKGPSLIDNVPYLCLWINIAELFTEYIEEECIWSYYCYLLQMVTINAIENKDHVPLLYLSKEESF